MKKYTADNIHNPIDGDKPLVFDISLKVNLLSRSPEFLYWADHMGAIRALATRLDIWNARDGIPFNLAHIMRVFDRMGWFNDADWELSITPEFDEI